MSNSCSSIRVLLVRFWIFTFVILFVRSLNLNNQIQIYEATQTASTNDVVGAKNRLPKLRFFVLNLNPFLLFHRLSHRRRNPGLAKMIHLKEVPYVISPNLLRTQWKNWSKMGSVIVCDHPLIISRFSSSITSYFLL